MKRKAWIDIMRGICMISILLFHTEVYYNGTEIIDYRLYVFNTLAAFFFISGYLFCSSETFSLPLKLLNIIKGIVVPYILFSAVIGVLKDLFYNGSINIASLFLNILSGKASWFIATLITSEVLFGIILWITKGKTALISTLCLLLLILLQPLANGYQPSEWFYQHNLWHINESSMALIFICLGYLFRKYETLFNIINKPSSISVLLLILIFIKYIEYVYDMKMVFGPLMTSSYLMFICDSAVSILLLISISKLLPPISFLIYTGRHSLVYYFICGGVPLVISRLLSAAGLPYNGFYPLILLAFILVYAVSTAITFTLYKMYEKIR